MAFYEITERLRRASGILVFLRACELDMMSTPKTHWKDDKQRGHGEDGKFTLLFDDNRSMGTYKRALEALPPRLQLTLNECRTGGSMRLSRESFDAWWLILQYAESDCAYSEFFDEINNECVETLVEVVRLCQMYGIASLEEAIDGATVGSIEELKTKYRRQLNAPSSRFAVNGQDKELFKLVKRIQIVKSENALASFLAEVVKGNEEWIKQQAAKGRTISAADWEACIGFFHRFIDEMHDAKRYRFCSLYAKSLMKVKFDASIYCTQD